jgi:hypothetical protein
VKRADDGGSRRRDGNREQDCPAGKGEASFGELEGEEIQFELSALLLAVRAIACWPRSSVREHAVDDVGDLGGHHVAGFLATAVPLGNPGLLVTVAVL